MEHTVLPENSVAFGKMEGRGDRGIVASLYSTAQLLILISTSFNGLLIPVF